MKMLPEEKLPRLKKQSLTGFGNILQPKNQKVFHPAPKALKFKAETHYLYARHYKLAEMYRYAWSCGQCRSP